MNNNKKLLQDFSDHTLQINSKGSIDFNLTPIQWGQEEI